MSYLPTNFSAYEVNKIIDFFDPAWLAGIYARERVQIYYFHVHICNIHIYHVSRVLFFFFFTFSVVCDTHFLNFNQQPHHYHQLHHRPHRQRMGKAWVVAATQQADEQDESSSTFTYEICNYLNVFTFPNLLCNLHHHSEFVRKFTTYKLQRRNTFTQSYISG